MENIVKRLGIARRQVSAEVGELTIFDGNIVKRLGIARRQVSAEVGELTIFDGNIVKRLGIARRQVSAEVGELTIFNGNIVKRLGIARHQVSAEVGELTIFNGNIVKRLGIARRQVSAEVGELTIFNGNIVKKLGIARRQVSAEVGELTIFNGNIVKRLGIARRQVSAEVGELTIFNGNIVKRLGIARRQVSAEVGELTIFNGNIVKRLGIARRQVSAEVGELTIFDGNIFTSLMMSATLCRNQMRWKIWTCLSVNTSMLHWFGSGTITFRTVYLQFVRSGKLPPTFVPVQGLSITVHPTAMLTSSRFVSAGQILVAEFASSSCLLLDLVSAVYEFDHVVLRAIDTPHCFTYMLFFPEGVEPPITLVGELTLELETQRAIKLNLWFDYIYGKPEPNDNLIKNTTLYNLDEIENDVRATIEKICKEEECLGEGNVEYHVNQEGKYNFSRLEFPSLLSKIYLFKRYSSNEKVVTLPMCHEEKQEHFDLLLLTDGSNNPYTLIKIPLDLYIHRWHSIIDPYLYASIASHTIMIFHELLASFERKIFSSISIVLTLYLCQNRYPSGNNEEHALSYEI
ncbi:hypothetical protein PR048_018718 [Dryococelus australis]|uniref:Uncharacterized protein n=1 Tax=Dryococelus australis TaxID=614101 RepID=A0ABQ9HD74_9NEOP|nr:hypothetical protein PR048_018718 [Dryococelus australis]